MIQKNIRFMPEKPRTVPKHRQALSIKVHDDSVATWNRTQCAKPFCYMHKCTMCLGQPNYIKKIRNYLDL
jgi:hypothetical protein